MSVGTKESQIHRNLFVVTILQKNSNTIVAPYVLNSYSPKIKKYKSTGTIQQPPNNALPKNLYSEKVKFKIYSK